MRGCLAEATVKRGVGQNFSRYQCKERRCPKYKNVLLCKERWNAQNIKCTIMQREVECPKYKMYYYVKRGGMPKI